MIQAKTESYSIMSRKYYINVNGKYGKSKYYKTGIDSLEAYIKEMDRLGIWGSVVTSPVNDNSTISNDTMLSDIERIPGAKERIIPGFIITPQITISPKELSHLKECVNAAGPSCVVAMPKTSVFRLREIERVLDYIGNKNLIMLIDIFEMNPATDTDDLIMLSEKYPEMKFVIRQVMWDTFGRAYDILLKTKNTYIDISWLHTRDAINILIDSIGSSRILFGTGRKSNNGASVAALEYACISEEDKDKIAYKNFIELFANADDRQLLNSNLKEIKPQVTNSFWEDFMKGEGFKAAPIIDVHTHMGGSEPGYYVAENDMSRQFEDMKRDMDALGIKTIVTSHISCGDSIEGNLELEACAQKFMGKEPSIWPFKGYVTYDPNNWEDYTEEYIADVFSRNYFIGFKSLPHYMNVEIDDERYIPMFEYAKKYDKPVLLHTWGNCLGSPAACAKMHEKYSEVKLILAHTGGEDIGRRECEEIAQNPQHKNIYFEFCGSFCSDISWEESLKRIDYRRVLFGSDAHLHSQAFELGRLLSLDIPDEWIRAILYDNAKSVLEI